jgi:GTPase involved in cell partitioning and DNA repair
VDELADPDMADFSSSQLVRDGEPFHKAKKGRTGGGRNSNRAAANTIEVIMGAPTGCVVIQDDEHTHARSRNEQAGESHCVSRAMLS